MSTHTQSLVLSLLVEGGVELTHPGLCWPLAVLAPMRRQQRRGVLFQLARQPNQHRGTLVALLAPETPACCVGCGLTLVTCVAAFACGQIACLLHYLGIGSDPFAAYAMYIRKVRHRVDPYPTARPPPPSSSPTRTDSRDVRSHVTARRATYRHATCAHSVPAAPHLRSRLARRRASRRS